MAYQLQSMLKIRSMREDRAQTELAGARRQRDAAQQDLDAKAETLSRFEETKEERRDRIYDAVIGRVVKMDDLDDARSAVTRIDEEGLMLEEAKDKAATELVKREEIAEGARVRHVVALKDLSKIEEHRKAWEEEDRREAERRADAEMEEFTGRRMVAEDDDSID